MNTLNLEILDLVVLRFLNTGEKKATYSEIEDHGKFLCDKLTQLGYSVSVNLSRRLTDSFLSSYTDFFKETENGIEIVRTQEDIENNFTGYLPVILLQKNGETPDDIGC